MSAIYWEYTKMQHWYWDRKTRKHKDRKMIRQMMMNRSQKTSRRPPMIYQDQRGGRGGGGRTVLSRFFDLLNSIIYDLKRSVDLRWLFDPVLHWSLDDLVFLQFVFLFLFQVFIFVCLHRRKKNLKNLLIIMPKSLSDWLKQKIIFVKAMQQYEFWCASNFPWTVC